MFEIIFYMIFQYKPDKRQSKEKGLRRSETKVEGEMISNLRRLQEKRISQSVTELTDLQVRDR